jgi:hypothetical protein
MIKRLWRFLALGIGLGCVLLALSFSGAHGQENTGKWSEPQLLLQGPPKDTGTNPIVYTGRSNNTYLLYFGRPAEDPGGPFALYYARWIDGGWTKPIDVLVTPDNALPPTLAAAEDSAGYLHVIWNTNAVWHTRVPIQAADKPQSWQTPVAIYGDRLALEVAAAIDTNDLIHVVMTSRDRTVDYISLRTDGVIGQPVLVHQIPDADYFPYRVSVVVTSNGRLITCWAEIANGARGVWCANSDDDGIHWGAPEMIATGHRGARLFYFAQKNQLGRVIWGGLGVGGRELQLSDDEGKTWSPPVDLAQGVYMAGYSGQVAAMDSAGDLHVLINPGDGRYVHARTRGDIWLPNAPTGWQASDWIEMAVAEGNTLVVVYWTMATNSTYTSHLVLDAPRIAPLPIAEGGNVPVVGSVGTATSTPGSQITTAPTMQPTIPLTADHRETDSSSGAIRPVLVGIIPAAMLVFVVALFQLRRRAS